MDSIFGTIADFFGIMLLVIVGCVAWGLAYGYYQYKGALLNHACTKVPPSDDARESARSIGGFLSKRTWTHAGMKTLWSDATERYGFQEGFVGDIVFGQNQDVVEFIRLCHACGCEVVVREVDTRDIEENPDILKEEKSKMREDWYARHGCTVLD